ncbi:hypothetical protein J2D73_16835, partial [Acetobacter sacchari]|nr:hypothetical protein [Acetobacter sacchari]
AANETMTESNGSSETFARSAGYVWNRILWDGTSTWSPPTGSAAIVDPDGAYPIGSTYSAS